MFRPQVFAVAAQLGQQFFEQSLGKRRGLSRRLRCGFTHLVTFAVDSIVRRGA
jgi:hypothetical protein